MMLKDIARKENYFVYESATLQDAVDKMNRNSHGVAVILKGSEPVGILTERDIVRILYRNNSMRDKAINFAYKAVVTVKGDRDVGFALNIMIDNNIRRVVVVDRNNAFAGVITQEDIVRHLEQDIYKTHLKVFHLLTGGRKLITVLPGTSLRETLRLMVENEVSSIVVVEKRKAVGIITERDILHLVGKNISLDKTVSNFMSSPVILTDLESTIRDVAHNMGERNIRRMVVKDKAGRPLGIITERDILRNIEGSYSRFLENKLRSAKDILNFLPEIIIDVIDLNSETIIQWNNKKAAEEFGESLIDRPITSLIPKDRWNHIYSQLMKEGKIEKFQVEVRDKFFEVSGYYIHPFDKGIIQLILNDITYQVKLSIRDPLTELYNRRYAQEFLKNEFERSRRYGQMFALAMIDIDDFKKINDKYGHDTGDLVLKSLADILVRTLRKADVVCRYGGEEFLVIMPKTDKKKAATAIEKLRCVIEQTVFMAGRTSLRVTASFGVAAYSKDTDDIQDLIAIADIRLYHAKHGGKNRVVTESVQIKKCRR